MTSIGSLAVRTFVEDLFGNSFNVPVMRLTKGTELFDLHLALGNSALVCGAELDQGWADNEKWIPHIKHTADMRLYPNQQIILDDVDLIARDEISHEKLIIHRFNLR